MSIYLYKDEQQVAYTEDHIRHLVASGQITPTELAWKEGLPGWSPLNTIIPFDNLPSSIVIVESSAKGVDGSLNKATLTEANELDSPLLKSLKGILTDGEDLLSWAVEGRLFALTRRRRIVAATTKRFISFHRNLFAGYKTTDFQWRDLKEAKIKAGILGTEIQLIVYPPADMLLNEGTLRFYRFPNLERGPAEAIYRLCQRRALEWRDNRRSQEIEEMRARSGGIQIAKF